MNYRPDSSKFYPKTLTLCVSILEMVGNGDIASKIARNLDINKSNVSYYIRKAVRKGYINEEIRDAVKILKLTQAGKYFVDRYHKNNISTPICKAENIQFKAVITQMPTIPVDWNKIEMNNWAQYTSEVDRVKVKLNVGKIPTIEFLPSPVEGEDPYDLYTILVFDCVNVILTLYDKIGLRVDSLTLSSRGEWLVYDPIARAFCKTNGQVTYEGIGKVNASPPRHIGEFEFHDPRALTDYLLMPKRLKHMEEMVEKILNEIVYLRTDLGRLSSNDHYDKENMI